MSVCSGQSGVHMAEAKDWSLMEQLPAPLKLARCDDRKSNRCFSVRNHSSSKELVAELCSKQDQSLHSLSLISTFNHETFTEKSDELILHNAEVAAPLRRRPD